MKKIFKNLYDWRKIIAIILVSVIIAFLIPVSDWWYRVSSVISLSVIIIGVLITWEEIKVKISK